MDFIETYGSIKDNKINRKRLKDFDKVIIDNKGTTFGDFRDSQESKINELELENVKLREELEAMKSKFTDSINKIIERKIAEGSSCQ